MLDLRSMLMPGTRIFVPALIGSPEGGAEQIHALVCRAAASVADERLPAGLATVELSTELPDFGPPASAMVWVQVTLENIEVDSLFFAVEIFEEQQKVCAGRQTRKVVHRLN